MHVAKPSFKANLFRFITLLLLTCFLSAGCGSDKNNPKAQAGPGPDDNPVSTPEDVENADFYGTYLVTATFGTCAEESFTLVIGNDSSRTGEENYVYLPENMDVTGYGAAFVAETAKGEVKVWRNDSRSVSFNVNEDKFDLTVTMTFDAEMASGTITGDEIDGPCEGAVSGTITLITKNPAEISDAYLQDRIYPDSGDDTQAAWIQVSKDGEVMDEAALIGAQLYLANGNDAVLATGTGATVISYMYGVSDQNGAVTFEASDRSEKGISLDLSSLAEPLAEGDYIFAAEIKDGDAQYTVKKQISYPGKPAEVSPVLTITDVLLVNGQITLTWEALDTPQDLYISFMKSNQVLMMVEVPAAPDTESQLTSITLTADSVDILQNRAAGIANYDLLAVQLHTRQYTEEGMNNARIYSQAELIPGTATGDDIDNAPFYGAYSLDTGNPVSITIGGNPDSACFDDYLYLPEDSLESVGAGPCAASVTRDADTLTLTRNGEILVFDFDYNRETAGVSEMLPGGEGEALVKTPKGTASLITRDPAVVQFAYIKSIYFVPLTRVRYYGPEACVSLKIGEDPILVSDMERIQIIDNGGEIVADVSGGGIQNIFQSQSYYNAAFVEDVLTLNSAKFEWSGLVLDGYSILLSEEQNTYAIKSWVAHPNGTYSVTCESTFPGRVALPVATINAFEMNAEGGLDISWQTTEGSFDELSVNICKISGDEDWFKYLLKISIKQESGVTQISIPSDMIDVVKAGIDSGDLVYIELQTHNYTESGEIISSGFSFEELSDLEISGEGSL